MVGRILGYLKKRAVLVEPLRRGIRVRRPRPPRPWAVRKPREGRVEPPGDWVEGDTMDLRPVPGVVRKPCMARDVISRGEVIAVRRRATATAATAFRDPLPQRLPFPRRALPGAGGGELAAACEEACRPRGRPLLVLPPRSPQRNPARRDRAREPHARGGVL